MGQESKHRKFTKEFREHALRRLSWLLRTYLAQLCRELGISRQLLYLWRDSQQREQQKQAQSAEYRLRRENAELKKAAAEEDHQKWIF